MMSDAVQECRLVFLNGWAGSSAMLEGFKTQLPSVVDLCVVDDLYQFELAEIVAKIDALMTENTVLVGWSLGGMLALYYASLDSSQTKLKALILMNTSACFLERHDYTAGVKRAEFDSLSQLVQAKDKKGLVRLFSYLLVEGSSSHKQDRRSLKQTFTVANLPAWGVLEKGLSYLECLDLRDVLDVFKLPIYCVLGGNDTLINATENVRLLDNIPKAKLNPIKGMGHYPFGLFAEKVTSDIVEYLASLNIIKNSVISS